MRKRETVQTLDDRYGVRSPRACGLDQVHRSTSCYASPRQDDRAPRLRLRELTAARLRFGYLRLHVLLRREGSLVNRRRIYRRYCNDGLSVRTRQRRKWVSQYPVTPFLPAAPNQRWSEANTGGRNRTADPLFHRQVL